MFSFRGGGDSPPALQTVCARVCTMLGCVYISLPCVCVYECLLLGAACIWKPKVDAYLFHSGRLSQKTGSLPARDRNDRWAAFIGFWGSDLRFSHLCGRP